MINSKIITLIKNLKRIKFSIPSKDLVIFDGECVRYLENIVKGYDYFVLEDRLNRINTIFITPLVIFYFFFYSFLIFKKLSIKLIYTIALIKSLKAKVIITGIDNSINFFICSKYLHEKIFFIALQNADRNGFEEGDLEIKNPQEYKKKLFLSNFICFGQREVDGSKKNKLMIQKFYKFGSLRIANFNYELKKNQVRLNKNLFDVGFISLMGENKNEDDGLEVTEKYIDLLKFTIKYVLENNLKFIFIQKSKNENDLNLELNFYKNYLSDKEYSFLISNLQEGENNLYSSYYSLFQSKVIVGIASTMLLEKIHLKEKILACNFTKYKIWDFPIDGICSMNVNNYDNFSSRLKLILNLENNDYFNKLDKKPEYVMSFDKNKSLIEKTRELIKENLNRR